MNTICKGVKKASTVGATAALLVAMAPSWPSVLRMLDKRQEKIQGDLDAAAKAREEANKDREIAAAGIDAAKQQADEIVSAAKREGEEERARIIEQAKAEAVEIITKGKGVVESERRHAMAELSDSVVDLAVDIAGKIIGNELSVEQQRALAEKYLAEVGTPDEH